MRTARVNPFLPGSDAVPLVWAGRALELADFHAIVAPRRLDGVYERGRVVLGEPGIGKSVLVNRIAESAAADGHLVLPSVRLAAGDDAVARTLTVVRDALRSLDGSGGVTADFGDLLDRVSEVLLPVVGGGVKLARRPVERGSPHVLLTEALIRLAEYATESAPRRLVLLRVDEVQHLGGQGLSRFLTAIGDALNGTVTRRDPAGVMHSDHLPIAVYLSGLPEFVHRASAAGATFARRFKPLELESLEQAELEHALHPLVHGGWEILDQAGPTRIRLHPEAAALIVEASHGSPFLFQLVGEAAWNAGDGDLITLAEALRGLDATARETRSYLRMKLQGLSDLQVSYLRAVARVDPAERTAGRIAEVVGGTSERLASTARILDEQRRLIRREAGRVRFRSPGLEELLKDEN